MLICLDCERKFEKEELATWEESRGEFWGMPCSETYTGCPYCYSTDIQDYDEYLQEEQEKDGEEE